VRPSRKTGPTGVEGKATKKGTEPVVLADIEERRVTRKGMLNKGEMLTYFASSRQTRKNQTGKRKVSGSKRGRRGEE